MSHAIQLDPRNAIAFSARGYIRQQLGELDGAFKDFNHAIKLNPRLAIAYIDRGSAWAAKNEFDKALADLNTAIRFEPANALAYAGRGLIWRAINEHVKAIDDFSEAIRIDPDCELAYLNRGAIWHESKAPRPGNRRFWRRHSHRSGGCPRVPCPRRRVARQAGIPKGARRLRRSHPARSHLCRKPE